jgi:hypothetical protein
VLALFMEMESGQVWSTRSSNGGVPPYRYTIAGSYVTVSTAGR